MVKRIKVKLIGKGTEDDPFTVNLPAWIMDREPDYYNRWAWVLVPDDEVDEKGRINERRIREKYREGWAKFDAESVKPPPPAPPKPSRIERIKGFFKRVRGSVDQLV